MKRFATFVAVAVAWGALAPQAPAATAVGPRPMPTPTPTPSVTHVYVDPDIEPSVNPDITPVGPYVGIPGHPGDVVARLTISRMGLYSYPVRKGVRLPQLALGPGIYRGSPAPGTGNFALAGHDVTPVGPWDHGPFHFIDQLRPGDTAIVEYHGHTYHYTFARRFRVTPDNTDMLRSQQFDMTMTTCWPPGSADYRMVAQWVEGVS